MLGIWQVVAIMAFMLAIFPFGKRYIPRKTLHKIFFTKDAAMTKRFLETISVLSICVFYLMGIYLLIDLDFIIVEKAMTIFAINKYTEGFLKIDIAFIFSVCLFLVHHRLVNKDKHTSDTAIIDKQVNKKYKRRIRHYNCARVYVGNYSYGYIAFDERNDTYHDAICS